MKSPIQHLLRVAILAICLFRIVSPASAQFAGGAGTPADPYQVATAAQLDAVRNDFNASYVLVANIDLNGVPFLPLRIEDQPFRGTFNGAGFAISNWSYTETNDTVSGASLYTRRTGFFSYLAPEAHVSNLRLLDCNVSANHVAGILAGQSEAQIVNCSTTGFVTANLAAGLVGINGPLPIHIGFDIHNPANEGSIVGCHSNALVAGIDSSFNLGSAVYRGAAGLVGNNFRLVRDCYATGAVSGSGMVGGLVGFNFGLIERTHATGDVLNNSNGPTGGLGGGNAQGAGYVATSYATGTVTGIYEVGGFLGFNENLVFNCYATGTVNAGSYAGGFSSLLRTTTNCYSIGQVNAGSPVGGFAADVFFGFPQFNNYWNTQTSGQATSATGVGKTTAEMKNQATYIGWNFTHVWALSGNNYPTLRANASLFPSIAMHPEDQYVEFNAPASFSVTPGGDAPFFYQWFFVNSLNESVLIPGATSQTLSFPNGNPNDNGRYYVKVSNPAGYVISRPGTLNVSYPAPPVLVTEIGDHTVNSGETLTLGVTATDVYPLVYRWSLNGVPVAGATSSELVLSSIKASQGGTYDVQVSNGAAATYSVGTVTVILPSIASIDPTNRTSGGNAFTLTVDGADFNPTSVVTWNGSTRPTTFVSSAQLTADIPASDLAIGNDVATVLVEVQTPSGDKTNARIVTIVGPEVLTVQSDVVAPGNSTSLSTLPTAEGEAGVASTFQHYGESSATLLVATYSANPTSVPLFDVGGKFVDVQITGASAVDSAFADFYYPSTITGTGEQIMTLLYFNGTSWAQVLGSGSTTPIADFTDNLNGTTSGGVFSVMFDSTSTPTITQLSGTVFGFAPPPVAAPGSDKHKPKITSQPQDQTVNVGGTATFTVVAQSEGPMTYQWKSDKKNGANIPGATGPTLTLHNVTTADVGDYLAWLLIRRARPRAKRPS